MLKTAMQGCSDTVSLDVLTIAGQMCKMLSDAKASSACMHLPYLLDPSHRASLASCPVKIDQQGTCLHYRHLTYISMHAELQMRSHGSSNPRTAPLQQEDAPQTTKRYLILAYKAEFDQILYPLPLCFEDKPEPEFFKSFIKRLQAERQAAMQVQTLCQAWHLIQSNGMLDLDVYRILCTVPVEPLIVTSWLHHIPHALIWHSC